MELKRTHKHHLALILGAALVVCVSCGAGSEKDEIIIEEERMDLNDMTKVETSELDKLATSEDVDGRLIFGKGTQLKTRVYPSGSLLISPFTGTPCVYFEVEVIHETQDSSHFIGGLSSEEDFYVAVGGKLVKNDVAYLDNTEPVLQMKYRSRDLPENVKAALSRLGLLEEAKRFPVFTVTENILATDHDYILEVEKFENTYPPEEPGDEPEEDVTYHFHYR